MILNKILYKIPTFTPSTWAILAITRFFLAFIVMYGHLYAQVLGQDELEYSFIYDLGGKAAVMVFLFISGISIGYSYLNNNKGFLKRRFLRIYPLYFVAVLFGILLQYYIGSPYKLPNSNMVAAGTLTSFANIFLLQGIVAITITYNSPLWSIGVEIFLYLMVPVLFLLRLRYILFITLISMLFFICSTSSGLYGYNNLIWAWPFLIGFIISVKKQFLCSVPLLLLCVIIVYYKKDIFSDSLSVINSSLGLFISCLALYINTTFSKNTLVFFNLLGNLSYPIYVLHWPLYLLLYHWGIREGYVFISLTIFLCIPFYYLFDVYLKRVFWKPLVSKLIS